MRKYFTGLMLLILVVLFATTFYCSIKTERVFQSQVALLNQNYPGVLQVQVEEYSRGLLLSEVQTILKLENRAPLQLRHQIRHFPWGVRVLTSLPQIAELSGIEALAELQLQSDVSLTGDAQSSLNLPELDASDPAGQLRVKGLTFETEFVRDAGAGRVEFRIEELVMNHPEKAAVTLSGLHGQSQFSRQHDLPLGQGTMALERLAVQLPGQPDFELQQLNYSLNSTLEDEELVSVLDLQLAELSLAQERFSQGLLRLRLAGIKAETLRELQRSANQLQVEILQQQVDPLILQLQLFGLYSTLLQDGLDLQLEQLQVHTDEGKCTGKGFLLLDEQVAAGAGMLALDQMQAVLQLEVDAGAFAAGFRMLDGLNRQKKRIVNRAVLNEQAEQLAGALVQKGIFSRRADGGYRLEAAFEQGSGRLNGQPFNF